ncbi:unnamed protein product [Spirodela intermedia]|uniref:Uncharacterized protein n=2 Tax=Spirodela intermedia TaxID=51605 RepID=A0A7I8IU39_SPIIN|nr:unnamed protein product [Spirodela intermedia]CAA6661336.1 unnamed protein product [Spirodela intermedia]CAA7397700.1 unnamed protein product [Spirodela intermedia]
MRNCDNLRWIPLDDCRFDQPDPFQLSQGGSARVGWGQIVDPLSPVPSRSAL